MTTINDGGPAFPHRHTDGKQYPGMSLRQFYAAKAMQGMYACQDFMNQLTGQCGSKEEARDAVSFNAFKQADAFIAFEANERAANGESDVSPE